MKRFFWLCLLLILCFSSGCTTNNESKSIEELLIEKKEQEEIKEPTENHDNIIAEDEEFVSVWPEELPKSEMNGVVVKEERPIGFNYEVSPGVWTTKFNYESMYLYDFPDPELYFRKYGNSMVEKFRAIHFYYAKEIEKADGTTELCGISREEFKSFIDVLKEAGYTDNSNQTETSYYCERYGVGISVVLSNEFPWGDQDPRLPFYTDYDSCFIQIQVIDPDYVMDIEAIKAEEYRKWLEEH